MQQIERVGVVALLFLLVTIVVVAFWDDGKPADSTRVAERDARREPSAVEERVRADERSLRDDGRVAARQDRERLSAPVGGSDDGIPRQRAVPDPERADRTASHAEARRARAQERADAERGDTTSRNPERGEIALELPRGRSAADEERLLRRGYANAPEDRVPAARVTAPAGARVDEPASRKVKPQAAPAKDSVAGKTWVVKSGESLGLIASRALGDSKRWPEIAALNGIENPNKIIAGQELQLPGGPAPARVAAAAAQAPSATPAAAPAAGGGEYVVQKGDMLSVIAEQRLGSAKRWREIAALNPKVDPNRLLVGTRLVLPAGAAPPSQPVETRLVARADDPNYRVR